MNQNALPEIGGWKRFKKFLFTIFVGQFAFAPGVWADETQFLSGHVPAVVARLQPIGALPVDSRLNLAIGLPLRNKEALAALLHDIYDPASPNFHHYLTPEQFTEKFGPTEQDYQAVTAFARANGLQVTTAYANRQLLDVSGSVGAIERALHLTLNVYRHPTENRTFYAPVVEPSLNLSVPILHISGLDNYELPRPHLVANRLTKGQNASPNAGSGPHGTYMGKDFRAAYVPDSSLSGSGQTVGLFEFDGYNPEDIAYYENAAGLPNISLQNVLIDGASGQASGSSADVEVALDIEMAISMATNLTSVIVYEAPQGAPFVDLLNQMASDNQVRQFSCSWYVPGGTADPTADQIWQRMAVQGQSFFNASGDSDAYTGLISFPGDTPYVTQVGGTTLTTSGPDGAWVSETVWNWGNELGPQYNGIGSSGGVSTQYPIPTWQTNISMAANQGSTVRRNTPDVAMTADNIYVRADGDDYFVGGTSCAAPLWAGFAALVNQQAATSGKSPIGLVNLAVDAIGMGANYASAFHDITTGNNTWRGSPFKFRAVSGYDLCTGWGTPAGQTLINALVNPEALIITPAAGFVSVGGSGGPFTIASQVFSVTNAGTNTLNWTLSNTSAWLNVSSGGGTLTPGGAATAVTVSLNSAASNLVVGTYSATLWFTNVNDGFGQSRQFALSIISPPAITTQPVNEAVLQGAAAGFSVQVTGGSPLFFQWQDDGTNLTDDGNISGSATSNLTINAVSPANVGTYSVVITNIAGTVTSSNVLLTITPSQPVITSQPTNLTTIIGSVAQFNVSVIGTAPMSYQWYWNGTNELAGATNAALMLNDVQLTNAGEYSVTISNLYGGTNSSEAVLTVSTSGMLVVPVGLANVEGSGYSSDLDWGGREQNVYGASYFPTQTIVITGIRFRPVVPGGQAFTNTISDIQFSLSSTPTAPDQLSSIYADNIGTNVTTVYDGSLPLSSEYAGPVAGPKAFDMVVNFTTPFVYNPSSGNLLVDIQDFSGEATSYTDEQGSSSDLASRVASAGGGSTSGTPDTGCAVLEVIYTLANQPPTIVTQPTNQAAATGNPVSFEVAAVSAVPMSYQWYYNGTNELVGATNAALTLNDVQLTNAGEYSVTVSNLYGTTISSNALLNVVTLPPTIVLEPTNETAVVGGSATFNVSATGSQPLNYQWYWNGTNLITGATNAALTLNDVQLTNAGEYSVTISNLYGGTNSFEAVLTVTTSGMFVVPVGLANVAGSGTSANLTVANREQDVYGASYFPTQTIAITGIRFRPTVNGGGQAFTNTISNIQFSLSSTTNSADHLSSTFANNIGTNVTTVFSGTLPLSSAYAGPVAGPKAFDMVVNFTTPFVYNPSSGNLLLDIQDYSGETTSYTDGQNSPSDLGSRVSAVGASSTSGTPDSSCSVLEIIYTVVGNQPPVIVTQPTNQTVATGNPVSFEVAAVSASPLNYQWYWNGTNEITGATNTALTLNDVQLTNAGEYSVTVSNVYGTTISSNALLNVVTLPPTIVLEPTNQTVVLGDSATFTVGVTGSQPLNYQWYWNGTNEITGATNTALTLNDVQLTNAGEYSVTISNLYGGTNSSEALLTVTTSGMFVVPAGLANVQGSGSSADLTVANREQDVYGASYFPTQTIVITGIRFRPTVNGGGQAFTNTISNIQFSLSSTTNSADHLSSTFANNIGTNVTTVFSGSLPLSSQYAGPADGPKAFDMVVNFTTPFVYNPSSGNLLLDIQDYSGETTSYTDGQNSPSDLGSRVSAVGASSTSGTPDSSCSVLEIIYTVVGNQPPVIVTQPTNQTAVVGNPVNFVVTAIGAAPLSYQWYWNGTNEITGATNTALTLNDVQLTNAGEYSVTISNLYGGTNSSEALLTVTTSGMFVVPAGLANVQGSGSSADLTVANREQDVYGASYFPTQTIVITGIRFRPTVNGGGQAFTNTISNIQFSLSSTTNSADHLSSTFANNIGTNVTTVFSGSLPLSSQYAGPADGPKAFDMVVNFTTPFVYNPSSGNLLLDIQDYSGETTSYTDGQNSPSDLGSRVTAVGASSTSGTPDSSCSVLEIAYTVDNQPPMIVTQPTNQTVLVGGSATFNVSATGSPLLNYQWYWNGTNELTGATNTVLTLNDVQLTNAGEYSVTISNLYGGTNSSEALLTVNDFLDHFIWSQISSTQFVNGPFTVTVQAQDPNNEPFTNFTGTVNLTSTNGIVVNPDVSPNFIQGTWTGSITISQTVSNLVLQANNGLGKIGLANPINIVSPPNLTTVREGSLLLIFWPVTPSGFVLETSSSLSPPEWVQVSNPPLQIGDQNLISVGISDTNNSFYRLQFSSP